MTANATQLTQEERLMRRAIEIALPGEPFASPNPSVGAVITDAEGLIIGEGFTSEWGGPHAEVNAVRSVKDASRLRGATVYVTLEPCCHFGKTPPCASMLVKAGVKRVVVGALDPFPAVAGKGVKMLREGGVEVVAGVLERECIESNRRFILAHKRARPYVVLKWAQSRDGFIAGEEGEPVRFSSPISEVWMHRERARVNAILAGTGTILSDNPRLSCRHWPNRMLRPVVLAGAGHIPASARVLQQPGCIVFKERVEIAEMLATLYSRDRLISLMVEGGRKLLSSFIAEGWFDEIRVETAPFALGMGVAAPELPRDLRLLPWKKEHIDGRCVATWMRPVEDF